MLNPNSSFKCFGDNASDMCCVLQDGAILVFLPGWEQIKKTCKSIEELPMVRNCKSTIYSSFHKMSIGEISNDLVTSQGN